MARVLLVNPPWTALLGLSSPSIPLGLVSLAGVLRRAGHQVAIHNAELHGASFASSSVVLDRRALLARRLADSSLPVWTALGEVLRRFRPDVVGVHAKTPSWASACHVARLAKELLPGVLTVCGGPHITMVPEDLRPESGFDLGVRGEGELALVALVEAPAGAGQRIPGVISASDPAGGSARPCRSLEDLDDLPFDGDASLLELDAYPPAALGSVLTARGCPFRCAYCAAQLMWPRVRCRSPEHVLDELEYLVRRHRLRAFSFWDDTFTLDRPRLLRILELVRRRLPPLPWGCTTRADCLDPELARELRRSGCTRIAVGLESGSERILRLVQKGESREEIARGCRALRDAGIRVDLFVMIGFPGETAEEAWETLRFARTLDAAQLLANVLVAYPGSPLHAWALEHKRSVVQVPWSEFHRANPRMALWDLPASEGARLVERWFAAVEAFNHHPLRLARELFDAFQVQPLHALRKAGSLLRHRITRPLARWLPDRR